MTVWSSGALGDWKCAAVLAAFESVALPYILELAKQRAIFQAMNSRLWTPVPWTNEVLELGQIIERTMEVLAAYLTSALPAGAEASLAFHVRISLRPRLQHCLTVDSTQVEDLEPWVLPPRALHAHRLEASLSHPSEITLPLLTFALRLLCQAISTYPVLQS